MDSNIIIEVDRNDLFNDAYNGIIIKSPEKLKNKLIILFKEEKGIDAESLLRYYYYF